MRGRCSEGWLGWMTGWMNFVWSCSLHIYDYCLWVWASPWPGNKAAFWVACRCLQLSLLRLWGPRPSNGLYTMSHRNIRVIYLGMLKRLNVWKPGKWSVKLNYHLAWGVLGSKVLYGGVKICKAVSLFYTSISFGFLSIGCFSSFYFTSLRGLFWGNHCRFCRGLLGNKLK